MRHSSNSSRGVENMEVEPLTLRSELGHVTVAIMEPHPGDEWETYRPLNNERGPV